MFSIRPFIARLSGVSQLRRRAARRAFLGQGGGMFWGVFGSAQEARAFLPASKRSSYEDSDVLTLNEAVFRKIHSFDWPVLFHLQKFLAERNISTLIDFGGHVGVKFHAFREPLDLKESFRWQVVDTPAMAERGRQQTAERATANLLFFDSLLKAEPAPILLCSGVLQYTRDTLEQLLDPLPWRPEIIILNKVPLFQGDSFYTLENFDKVKLPYRIFAAGEHQSMRERMGYRCLAQWEIPDRDFSIPYSKPHRSVQMTGEVWLRREDGV